MRTPRLTVALLSCFLAVSIAPVSWAAEPGLPANVLSFAGAEERSGKRLDERRRAVHALNRLTFGPRPGELERVRALGVDRWIEQQLNPDKIDDRVLDERLAGMLTWKMSTEQMLAAFPPRRLIRAVAKGKVPMPQDADERLVYETAVRRFRDAQEKNAAAPSASGARVVTPPSLKPPDLSPQTPPADRQARQEARHRLAALTALPPEQRLRAFAALTLPEMQSLNRLSPAQKATLISDLTPRQRETLLALVNPELVVTTELEQGKLLRAIYSERQLQEVMTDFWMNHFNVFIGKGLTRYLLTAYERDVMRPRALGKFRDLLIATAQSPAMLWYLDNWQSVGPHSAAAGRAERAPRGLNENYARELLELHTLGVNGGYTQQDVTELARILTGWSIEPPRGLDADAGGFLYRPRTHEPGPKTVLGRTFKEAGQQEGVDALDMLARHPATARFLSRKLAMRFVADNPPPALVERMARTYLKSDGDIRSVLRAMFRSAEFWSAKAYRAKVKTPFEFVVSSIRTADGQVQYAQPLVGALRRMGMPPYGSQPPTGYSMMGETWMNSAALVERMNFALALGSGRLPGTRLPLQSLLDSPPASGIAATAPGDARAIQARLENPFLMGDVSPETHAAIAGRVGDPQAMAMAADDSGSMENLFDVLTGQEQPAQIGVTAGLILGSPEFQRR